MAAALTMMAKQRGGPRIRAQLLYYPLTDPRCDSPSHGRFAEGYLLTNRAAQWYWQQYADGHGLDEPTASPLRATREQLKGLPPAPS